MVERQFPKPGEIFELMRFKKPELDGKKRRLATALTIYDLRDIARRRTPRAAFDYADGAAEGEFSLARARQAFEDIEFHPSILKDVSRVDTVDHCLRRPVGAAVRHRADRLHPPDADRGRGGRRGRGRRRGHPVHALHPRHHLDRGRQGGQPGRPQLVPALRHARPGDLLRAHQPRRRGRIRHPVLHRRRPRRRRAAARQAQRLFDPAAAHARHHRQRDPAALVVVGLPDHPKLDSPRSAPPAAPSAS